MRLVATRLTAAAPSALQCRSAASSATRDRAPRAFAAASFPHVKERFGGARQCATTASAASATSTSTPLGEYLRQCGATWGEVVSEMHDVVASEDGLEFRWQVDLPDERLQALRQGESIESPLFSLGASGSSARFQFFPKGDEESAEGACSLWLCSDGKALGPLSLQIGSSAERSNGASSFCQLQEALGGGSSLEVGLRLKEAVKAASTQGRAGVEHSLQLTGLERAEWRVFGMRELMAKKELHTSPPFRFHHVLLGDMYLEILPGAELCTIFFRCRVPTMRLQVGVSVGSAFSKNFVAVGRATYEDDMQVGSCLQVNLDAPDVLNPDGSLTVDCVLEKVVSIPNGLRDMMPKLDERALWPKRL